MATQSRRTASSVAALASPEGPPEAVAVAPGAHAPLVERLFGEGYSFDFFQAVRILQQLSAESQPVGRDAPPHAEAARFRVHNSLIFPASTIQQIERAADQVPMPAVTVNFFGITGPSGALPRHYTELLYRAQRDLRNPERFVLRDWFDLFNHRLISLFYRAWSKYRFWLAYEQGEYALDEPDAFTQSLFSLIGLAAPTLRNRLRISCWEESEGRKNERVLARLNDLVLLYYSGLLAHRPRCAVGLESILEDCFALPVQVQQFRGHWLQLDEGSRSTLSEEGNNLLGMNVVVGSRVWDVQSKIRLRLGPLGFSQFVSFLPDPTPVPQCKKFFELVHLARFYVGPEFNLDVQLVLKGEEVPECRLPLSTADGPQLGWNAWVRSQSMTRDPDDAVFDGEEIVWVNRPPQRPRG